MADQPNLEDVFKISGVPRYTFVEPEEFGRLLVALRTPGRGVVIEGPSGIGKTTAVSRALEVIPGGDKAQRLSGRRREDALVVAELPSIKAAGTVIIDDFHRLDAAIRNTIADHLKLLADEEDSRTKLVIIGINRAGESLVNLARDLTGRLDVIRFEANSLDRVRRLVHEGASALNVDLPEESIAEHAAGSFHLAQMLCHAACVNSGIYHGSPRLQTLSIPFEVVLERVMDDLALRFMETAMKFASGPRFSREGRAPYLHILKWLGERDEWTISLDREIQQRQELRLSVGRVVDRGYLADFLAKNADLGELLHFDTQTHVLAIEDPKFFFFLKNLKWAKFTERVGYLNTGFTTKYDFALSFAGADRDIAELIYEELTAREFAVFYDLQEQSRILAGDVAEYLAPIYQTEASFVLCLLSDEYPKRLWTAFESRQFRARFGTESVIPVVIDAALGMFDEAAAVGNYPFTRAERLAPQVERLAMVLQQKIADIRVASKLSPGEFKCRQCNMVLSTAQLADNRVAMCLECAERYKIK